jgi:hypothetical protein
MGIMTKKAKVFSRGRECVEGGEWGMLTVISNTEKEGNATQKKSSGEFWISGYRISLKQMYFLNCSTVFYTLAYLEMVVKPLINRL